MQCSDGNLSGSFLDSVADYWQRFLHARKVRPNVFPLGRTCIYRKDVL